MSVEEKLQVPPLVVHSLSQYSELTDNSHFAASTILNIVNSLNFMLMTSGDLHTVFI